MIVGSVRNINTQPVYIDKDAPQCNPSSRSRWTGRPGERLGALRRRGAGVGADD